MDIRIVAAAAVVIGVGSAVKLTTHVVSAVLFSYDLLLLQMAEALCLPARICLPMPKVNLDIVTKLNKNKNKKRKKNGDGDGGGGGGGGPYHRVMNL